MLDMIDRRTGKVVAIGVDRHTMSSGDVARALNVGLSRVHQLDAQLKPVRRGNNHRRYDPEIVKKYLQSRRA